MLCWAFATAKPVASRCIDCLMGLVHGWPVDVLLKLLNLFSEFTLRSRGSDHEGEPLA